MRALPVLIALAVVAFPAYGQLVISGNENKIDLSSGTATMVPNAQPDTVSILDFSKFPPAITNVEGVSNSVIGPPSNVAITPDQKVALVASSVKLDPNDPTKYVPDDVIHVLDLTASPPKVVKDLKADQQPSGLSISKDGTFALVANRAAGTVSLLTIDGLNVAIKQTLKVCEPAESVADVAISPDQRFAIASVCDGGYLVRIDITDQALSATDRKFSVCGKPYRCVITPDGAFAMTAGSGQGLPDADAVTVVDLKSEPQRTIDYVPTGSGPESMEVSPDGKLAAVVLMAGSNLPADSPQHANNGQVDILARRGKSFVKVQTVPTGPIPEGVAFSPDGRYLIVQCHPLHQLWLYEVKGESVHDTGARVTVPGMPSSIRASVAR